MITTKISNETLSIHNRVLWYQLNLATMARPNKLAKLERQIYEVCDASERIALRVAVTALYYVGLVTVVWLLIKHV